ncbi:MAG: PilZ domain-containing protein [Planctomycetota bacterium]
MTHPESEPTRTGSWSGREQRKHPRARAEWSARIAVEGGFTEVQLRDVSAAGVCFFSDQPIPELTLLGLHLDVPEPNGGQRAVDARGAVVRCEPISPHLEHYEVAVFLNDIASEDRQALADYVRRRDA